MRKILLYLITCCSFFFIQSNLSATHIMGGEITWECDAMGRYIFTFKTYRDCSGLSNGGPNSSFAIQNYPSLNISTPLVENTALSTQRDIGPNCRPTNPNFQVFNCANDDPEVVVEYTRVMQPITLTGAPPPQGWVITYSQNARNANDNLLGGSVPNAHAITLRARIFPHSGTIAGQCVDNSPQFREEATSLLCTGSSFTYNHNATDKDLDSLAYSWANPLDIFTGSVYNEGVNPAIIGFEPGFSFNNPFPGPETLNSATGEITLNPPTGGKYISVIRVTAFKCGERVAEIYRELQSVISNNCQANQTKPTIDAPFADQNGNFVLFSDTVQAGDLVTFPIAARDIASINFGSVPPYLGDTVIITATGQQFGTNFTSTTGCDNPPCATLGSTPPIKGEAGAFTTFTWQTDCNHVSFTDRCISDQNTYTFVITAIDDECPIPAINISTISITVVGDTVIDSPTLNCVDVQPNGDVNLDWNLTPNINNSFTGWMIYSGTDRNGPFTLIDSVLTYSVSTYTHVGANADNQQRFYHVRSRSGCKGRVINIARDTVSTIFLSATNSATDVTVNWTALNSPNPVGSANAYRVFREYPVGSGFNLHQTTASTSLNENFTVCEDTVTYRVELINASNSCTSSSQILGYRFQFAEPQTNFTFPNNQCPGVAIAFTNQTTIAGGTVSYAWDFGDGIGTSTQQNPSYTYANPGTYTVSLTATSDKGCDSTLTRQIQITLPTADAGMDQAICPGGNVPIGGSPTTTAGNTILWSPTTGLSNASIANPTAAPSSTTTYIVTVTDVNGCTNTDQVTITVNPIPTADAGIDRSTCPGIGVTIGGTPTGPLNATYSWSPVSGLSDASAANPSASPTVTTVYTVTVTSGVNCSATDQVTVTVNPTPNASAGLDQTICNGGAVVIGGAPTSTTPGVTYLWNNATSLSNAASANPMASPNITTVYTVTVTDVNGCEGTDQVTVNVNPLPNANAGPDQNICGIGSATIGGSPTSTTAGATFAWSNSTSLSNASAANPVASPLTTTTYTVTVTDLNGCTDTDQVTVTIDAVPTADAGADQTMCSGETRSIGGVPTGPIGSTFSWSPTTGLSNASASNPTTSTTSTLTYTVTVTAANGCTSTDMVTVNVLPLPGADAGLDQVICNGNSVTIGGSPTSNDGGAAFSWSNAASLDNASAANPTATPIVTTTYTVTVTGSNGCTSTDQVIVTVNNNPTADAGMDQIICNGGNTTIGGSPTGLVGSTFAWSPTTSLSNSTVANPIAAPTVTTTYTVTVTSGVNCTSTDQVTVIVNPNPDADAGMDQTICLNENVTIGGAPTSNVPGATFAWNNSMSLDNALLANPTASPSVTTTYTVTVTHPNGCTATDQVIVNVNSLPSVDAGPDQFLCNGGSIPIGGSPTGLAGSVFAWNNSVTLSDANASNPLANPTVTTTYTVTVTDVNGCTATDDVTVNVGTLPTADAGMDRTICAMTTTQLGGAPTGPPGATYVWDNSSTLDNANASNPNATPLATTTYSVTVTDAAGCSQTDAVMVTVEPIPTVDAGSDVAICVGNSVPLGGTPTSSTVGATFAWDNSTTLDNVNASNPNATPMATTTYTVTVTHPNGCTSTDQITVTVNNLPTADAGADQTICEGGNTTIGGSPTGVMGSIFAWSPSIGLSNTSAANPIANPLTTTTYTVTVTSGVNCTNTDQVTVTVNPNPDADAGIDQTICVNESVQIGGAPTSSIIGATFTWDNTTSLSNSADPNPTATPLMTTTYTVTVTHPNGCTATDQVTVNVNPLPLADAGADVDLCIGGTIQIGGSPTGLAGSSFNWDNPGTLSNTSAANPIANPLVTTTYTVTVTDLNGCTNTDDVTVTVNPLPIVDAGMDVTICNGENTTIGGSPTGPMMSTYVWDNTLSLSDPFVANPQAMPSTTTTYSVTVTDNNGCTATDQITVMVNPVPDVDAGTDVIICEMESTTIGGAPTSSVVGATFSWDNATSLDNSLSANPTANPTVTTTYTVTVSHPNGCTATDQVTVIVEPLPLVGFSFANVCLSDLTQFTDASSISSGSIQSWTWDFGDGVGTSILQNPTYQYTSAGTFNVKLIVGSIVGCRDSISIPVTINPLPIVDAGPDQTICNLESITLGGSPTSTTTGVTYAWDNAMTLSNPSDPNPVANPSVTTTYTVTVTDMNGCFDTDQVTVTVNPLPVVDYTFSQTCINEITQFTDISSISSGSNQSWTWDFGDGVGSSNQQNPSYQFSSAGTFAVKLIVESDLGCRDSITRNVTINPIPVVDFNSASTCFGDITQFTDLSSIPSGSNQNWRWDFGDGVGASTQQNPTYQFSSTGTFAVKLVVESDFGCSDSLTRNIIITPLPVVDAGADQVICNNGSVTIGGAPTSTTSGVTYAWDNPTSLDNPNSSNPVANPSVTTTYTVTVTNGLGCVNTDQVTVTVNPTPTVSFTASMTCLNDITQFTDNSTLSVGTIQAWRWDFGDGVGASIQQNPTYQFTSVGTYNVKLVVETAVGCPDSLTIPVVINPLPTADAGVDQTICNTQMASIGGSPTSTSIGATYAWDNATSLNNAFDPNPMASPSVTTTYTVTVTDLNGCTMTDQVTVFVNPLPSVDFSSTQVCLNDLTQFTDLSSIASPSSLSSWQWDFGDGIGGSVQQNPSYTYLSSGIFTVKLIVTSSLGCIDSLSKDIIVDALPTANAGMDRIICEFDTTELGEPSVVGETYNWDNPLTLSSTSVANPMAFPLTTTTYSVTVTNTNGCSSVDEVLVTVSLAPDANAGPDVTICNTDSVQIGGAPTTTVTGSTYLWNNAGTLNDATLANPMAAPSDTTEYIVTVTDPTGCSFTDTMVVNVNPLPIIDFRVDENCESDFVAFTDLSTIPVGSIVSWEWDFGDGIGSSALQNPGYQYLTDGNYDVQLKVTSTLGCVDSITQQVIILPLPNADAGSDLSICFGDTVRLGGSPTGMNAVSFQWSPGFDLSSVTESNPMAYPLSSTTYFLTVTAQNGCTDFDTVNVTVNSLPTVTAMQDSTLCINQPVQLNANGANSYSWSPITYLDDPFIANPIATALKDVEYVVTGTDINGCINTDTINISVFNIDFLVDAGDTSVCAGESIELPVRIQGDTVGITYSWSPTTGVSDPTIINPMVTPVNDQIYRLEITNADGCVDIDSVTVTLNTVAGVNFDVLNSPRCSGAALEIQNTSVNVDNYIWKLNGEIRSDDINPPTLGIDNTVLNTLTLIGSNANCTDSLTQTFEAASLRTLLQLKDANVFTPNGDGINDIYDPGFVGEFIGCVDFQIFDRWGTKVFDSNIGQYGWDGITLRGRLAPTGIYYYVIKIANEEIRGSVYLTR